MSDIHSHISIKEGTMLGLKASASSDASVVRGVTMQIVDLEDMYTDLTRELCVHHRRHLSPPRGCVSHAHMYNGLRISCFAGKNT